MKNLTWLMLLLGLGLFSLGCEPAGPDSIEDNVTVEDDEDATAPLAPSGEVETESETNIDQPAAPAGDGADVDVNVPQNQPTAPAQDSGADVDVETPNVQLDTETGSDAAAGDAAADE